MRGLRTRLEGRVIVRVTVNRPDLRWALPPALAGRLTGARVLGFRRRAKYILMRLDGGDSVLLHLGMSGAHGARPPPIHNSITLHEHVVLETDDGWRVGFVDPRRFGSIDLWSPRPTRIPTGCSRTWVPNPWARDFTAGVLKTAPRRPPHADQGSVARPARRRGARQHLRLRGAVPRAALPRTAWPATSPPRDRPRLVQAIRATLTEAIAAGGSSLRDYVQPDGELGYFPARLEGLWPGRPALRALPRPARVRRDRPAWCNPPAAASIAREPSASYTGR